MQTTEYRVQKHRLCYNSIRHRSYHQFHWYASPASKLSWKCGISLLLIIHSLHSVIHIAIPLLFSTYNGHCVASLFNMVACYWLSLFLQVVFCLSRSLVWALQQDFCMWGRHLQRKFQRKFQESTCTEILHLHCWLAITNRKSSASGRSVKK